MNIFLFSWIIKPLKPGSISNLKKTSGFDTVYEFGLISEKSSLIKPITDHPFKSFLINMKEINLGYAIKKLYKEEIIHMIDKFFIKMSKIK